MTGKNPTLFLGCISGTSVDGLDIALLEVHADDDLRVLHAETAKLPPTLQANLLQLGNPAQDDLELLGQCDSALGEFIGHALVEFLQRANTSAERITAIGSHGQTVRHRPPAPDQPITFTTQIGDPNRIVEITGITTVADFRRRDMAAGGHGAPLAPPFHQALFGSLQGNVAVLNLGGISNISVLGNPTRGFDTGPGNCLMDSWTARHLQQPYDDKGQWAATGQVDEGLLQACLEDPYFSAAPPKSTGREYFNLAWLEAVVPVATKPAVDVQATLCALTAACNTDAIQHWAPDTSQLIVCGGGRLNSNLMHRLATPRQGQSKLEVRPSEDFQVDGDSIEAAMFAWLAYRRLQQMPGNEPAVTGAEGYRVLGGVYPA